MFDPVGLDLQDGSGKAADMWQQLCSERVDALVAGAPEGWDDEYFTPLASTIRVRHLAAATTYMSLMPYKAHLVASQVDIGNGVVVDNVWEHHGEVVIDELDQEDMTGNELRLWARLDAICTWGAENFDGFAGVRIVNLLRPHRAWFVSDVQPVFEDDELVDFDVSRISMPDWIRT